MNKHIVLAFIVLIVCYSIYWGNNCLDVTRHIVITDKLSEGIKPLKILHLSDLHNKRFGKHQERLLKVIKNENPDIIVFTGDIVDSRRTDFEPALELLDKTIDIAPTYFITGNHDVAIPNYESLLEQIEATGTTYIANKSLALEHEGAFIHLHGVDDSNLIGYKTFYENLELLSTAMDTEEFNILLVHKPRFIETYATLNYDLVFSGHAHGGQIRLPGIGGILSPGQGFLPKYSEGLIEKDDTSLVVSRGLGNSLFPFRVLNNPEVVVVTIQPI